jgi:hypothetical protein
MNIFILNGNPDPDDTRFDRYVQGYQLKLHKTGHYVKTFRLRDMVVGGPDDNTRYITASLHEADLLVWGFPVKRGAMPVLVSSVQSLTCHFFQHHADNSGNPYLSLQQHPKVPLTGILVQPDAETTAQDMLMVRLTQERMAADLKTILSFFLTTQTTLASAVCETFRSFDYRSYIEDTCEDLLLTSLHERASVRLI